MFPNIGEMTTQIRIESPVTTRNDFGDELTEWQTVFFAWGKKRYQSGNERISDGQKNAQSRVIYWTHYCANVKETDRIFDCETGEFLDITFISVYRMEGWMRIEATAMPSMAQNNIRGRGQ